MTTVDTTTGVITQTDDRLYPVPADSRFEDNDAEFLAAPDLDALAGDVIAKWDELGWLEGHTLRVLWKRGGGEKGGNATLGKCTKPAGLLKFFVGVDWVVWLAADHARELGLTYHQVEALLYHELCHPALKGKDDKPSMRGHDVEMFRGEVKRYGLWKFDLHAAAEVMQAALPGFEAKR